MSYHGSVRCSFCGEVGHNRRTCEYLKKQIKEWQASDDPIVRKRATLLHHTTNRPRKCSFCKQPGHTVRTCPEMTAHVQDVADSWLGAKRFVKEKMFKYNFGIGTLTRVKRRRWDPDLLEHATTYDLALVTEINYSRIIDKVLTTNSYFRQMTPVQYVFVSGEDIGQHRWGRLPRTLVDRGYKDADYYGKSEYEKSADDYVILNATQASFPEELLGWDLIWNEAYAHVKGKK